MACSYVWIRNIAEVCTVNDRNMTEKSIMECISTLMKKMNFFLSLSALLLHLFSGKKKFCANNKYANFNLSHSFRIFNQMLDILA